MAAPALPADIATALRYGPTTQSALQRSRYLAGALEQMRDSSQQVRTPTEMWTKLLAAAITSYSKDKADRTALAGVKADQEAYAKSLIEGLDDLGSPAAPQAAPGPVAAPAATQAPAPDALALASALRGAPATPAPAAPDVGWQANKKQESNFNGNAVGKPTAYGTALGSTQMLPATAKAMAEKLGEPWRPELMVGNTPEHLAYQDKLGRAYWDEGLQKYGGDPEKAAMYYHGGPDEKLWGPKTRAHAAAVLRNMGSMGGDAAPAAAMPSPAMGLQQAPPQQQPAQPVQIAMQGQIPPGILPSPQAASPGGGGAAPGVQFPQAAPGAMTMKPTQQQVALVRQLLADPRTYDQGVAYALKLRQQAAEAVKLDSMSINGMPFQVNPYTGERRAMGVPQEAMTQVMGAQAAGVGSAPAGTYLQRDPLGNVKDVPGGTPPQGYGVQGDGYAPIRGGPADPMRPQAPASGYEYRGGQQAPIQGGPADPRNPQAILAGTESIRREIAPIVEMTQKLNRNIAGIRVGFQQKNGAGDIAMINGLQRLIDEGVVREGDVALQLKGQGLEGTLSGLKGYMSSEGFFSDPAVRQKVFNVGEALYKDINAGYRDRVLGYKPIAENAYGPDVFEKYILTPGVVESLGWGAQAAPGGAAAPAAANPAQFAPGSAEQALAVAVKRGIPLSGKQLQRARELGLVR